MEITNVKTYGNQVHRQSPLSMSVSLLDCPPGFILTPNGSCDCVPVLKHYRITCTIDDQTVHRIAPLWIGYQPPAELDAHSNTTSFPGPRRQLGMRLLGMRLHGKLHIIITREFGSAVNTV